MCAGVCAEVRALFCVCYAGVLINDGVLCRSNVVCAVVKVLE